MPSQSYSSVWMHPSWGFSLDFPCLVQCSVVVWYSVAELFWSYPGSGFAVGTAGRPAPAAAVSGASGLGVAPQAPAIYTPESK